VDGGSSIRWAVSRRGVEKSHHTPAAHVRPVRRTGGGTDDISSGGARGPAQLGLPVRVAARCEHRPERLPRRRQDRRGPLVHALAATRQQAHATPPRGSLLDPRPPRPARTGALGRRRLQQQQARSDWQRSQAPASARRVRVGLGRCVAAPPCGTDVARRDVAGPHRVRRLRRGALAGAGRGHLGGTRREVALRPLQADGVARA
jgi:hypothetical protein